MAALSTETLQDVIDRFVSLGEVDPLTIAKKIEKNYGREWVAIQLVALSEDIVATMARNALGNVRRKGELALRPGDEITSANLKIAKTWIPGEGWKKVADLTPSDLRARADWYDRFAAAATRRAEWCRDVAVMIESEGVNTLGGLKATLPVLPDSDLELPAG